MNAIYFGAGMADDQQISSLPQESEILLYRTEDGSVKVDALYQAETIWLTQKKMSTLFGVETNTINYHLKEVFKNSELSEDSVIRKIRITADDGKKYPTQFYNLDAIIAVSARDVAAPKASQTMLRTSLRGAAHWHRKASSVQRFGIPDDSAAQSGC
jgi:hypothetical protein